jgi:hypothetical protein
MLRLKVKSQSLFGVRVDGSHKKHKAFAFSMMLATIKWFEFTDIRTGSPENVAGLPVLQSMSNKSLSTA